MSEYFRRREPMEELLDESMAALDHVLQYLVEQLPDHPIAAEAEVDILGLFLRIQMLREKLKPIIPPDDF